MYLEDRTVRLQLWYDYVSVHQQYEDSAATEHGLSAGTQLDRSGLGV